MSPELPTRQERYALYVACVGACVVGSFAADLAIDTASSIAKNSCWGVEAIWGEEAGNRCRELVIDTIQSIDKCKDDGVDSCIKDIYSTYLDDSLW